MSNFGSRGNCIVFTQVILGYLGATVLIQKYSKQFIPKEDSKRKVNNVVFGGQYLSKEGDVDLVTLPVLMAAVLSGSGRWLFSVVALPYPRAHPVSICWCLPFSFHSFCLPWACHCLPRSPSASFVYYYTLFNALCCSTSYFFFEALLFTGYYNCTLTVVHSSMNLQKRQGVIYKNLR